MLPLLGLLAGMALGAITDELEMHSKYHWYCCKDCKECSHRRNCKDFGEYVGKEEDRDESAR